MSIGAVPSIMSKLIRTIERQKNKTGREISTLSVFVCKNFSRQFFFSLMRAALPVSLRR